MPEPDTTSVWQSSDLASEVLRSVRAAIPLGIEQIDTMLQLITAARGPHPRSYLDLGCGEGLLSSAILSEFPGIRGTLVDGDESTLAGARRHLRDFAEPLEFLVADLTRPDWVRRVQADGPFDAIVSGMATHALTDLRKRELYREIFGLLVPGGIFVNIEIVASSTRWTGSVWDDFMIDAIFGRMIQSFPDRSRAEVAREYFASAAHAVAPLEVQCDWLRESGFENVDTFLKVCELTVFAGQRPATGDE